MKIAAMPQCHEVLLTSESPDDLFRLGKLAAKLKQKASVRATGQNGNKELRCDWDELVKLAIE